MNPARSHHATSYQANGDLEKIDQECRRRIRACLREQGQRAVCVPAAEFAAAPAPAVAVAADYDSAAAAAAAVAAVPVAESGSDACSAVAVARVGKELRAVSLPYQVSPQHAWATAADTCEGPQGPERG